MTATADPSSKGSRRPPTRVTGGRTALAALAVAVLGAAALAAILFATGAIGDGTTTVESRPVTTGPAIGTGALHPAALYTAVSPGVVDITAHTTTTVASPLGSARQKAISSGAGIVLDRQGHILTADHVVRGASSASVTLADGTSRGVRILGQDPATDLAVLGVDPSGLTLEPLALGDSAALAVGNPVAAIGDPFGYRRSLSTGIVSGLDRTIQGLNGSSVPHAVQTDAAIDPGNSGGPLLDAHGSVIGVVDQIATGNSGADSSTGVGFAIPSNVAKAEIGRLERGVTPTHAYLGIESAPAVVAGRSQGVMIQGVQAGGPAARAGLRAGDVVRAIDGRPLRGVNDLIAVAAAHRPGQILTVRVRRGSRLLTVRVVLGAEPRTAPEG